MSFGSGSNWRDFTPARICKEWIDVTVFLFHDGIQSVQILEARYITRDRRDVFTDRGCGSLAAAPISAQSKRDIDVKELEHLETVWNEAHETGKFKRARRSLGE